MISYVKQFFCLPQGLASFGFRAVAADATGWDSKMFLR